MSNSSLPVNAESSDPGLDTTSAGTSESAPECMTACELASWLRVNRKTVYEYAARNIIPCRRLGRRLLFLRAAVEAWLARSSTEKSGLPVGLFSPQARSPARR